jgi:hypothetical protein
MKDQLNLDEPVHAYHPRCLHSRRLDAIEFRRPMLTHSSRRLGRPRYTTCGRRQASVPVFRKSVERMEWAIWNGICAAALIVQESQQSRHLSENRSVAFAYEISPSRATASHMRYSFTELSSRRVTQLCTTCTVGGNQHGEEPSSKVAADAGYHSGRPVKDRGICRPGRCSHPRYRYETASRICERQDKHR